MKNILSSIVLLCSLAMSVAAQPQKMILPQIPVHATLENPESFSVILLPDPQSYVKSIGNQPIFELQTSWVAENAYPLNVKAVLVTGDMVQVHDMPHLTHYNQTSRQQWEAASLALERLDNVVPYLCTQGNHDCGFNSGESRHSVMPQYIYPERNRCMQEALVSTCPNVWGDYTMENAAIELDGGPSWGKILVISLEFEPRDEAIEWAASLASSDRFKNDKVIILVHAFLDGYGNRFIEEGYTLQPRNWAEDVWRKLVFPSKNIVMVLCGHAGDCPTIPEDIIDISQADYAITCAFRTDSAADGHPVAQMMFNSQMGDGVWAGNGGDGWLRILEFKPDGKTIGVRTFSPLFAISRLTAKFAWRTAPYDQFDVKIPEL